ncbi:hypothetical protein [Marivita hallyeonensis]|uniref:Uncharacterized protein n=1 Tax=Marivita hallyeonensis TaxID=996342 RepID=A0A1M5X4E0_9RHOB|nr:hypothetical protein [Marivita hallyeonensis]SHH94679.1 hypothetical protein SAMN05443551_3729 [Marivita hallyeonensis]
MRYRKLDRGRGTFDLSLFAIIGSLQIFLISIHIWMGLATRQNPAHVWPDMLNIARDYSLGELLNYALWVVIIACVFVAWRRARDPLLLATAFVYLLAFVDDAFQLHERSAYVVMALDFHLSYSAMIFTLAELVVWAFLGLIFFGVIVLTWPNATAETRAKLAPQAILFGVLVFLAVGIDVIHQLAEKRTLTAGIIGVIEDGGEMLVLTAMLAHALPTFGRDTS